MVKFCLVLIAVVACWAVNVQGDDDVEAAWSKHRAQFPVRAASPAELAKRKAVFTQVHNEIVEHNKKSSTFRMAHNRLSHLTSSEKEQLLGHIPKNHTRAISYKYTSKRASVEESVDLRGHDCMQAVKNQGGCGSCWAFAATNVVEFGHCLLAGSIMLSEQQMVDCSTKDGGCNGGNYESAWEYLASAGGQQPSYTYEYTGTDGTCVADQSAAVATVSSEVTYVSPNDVQTMQALLSNNQLLGVAIAVVDSFFSYADGVYTESDCTSENKIRGYHAIVAVGYGSLDGNDYWIVRNSWGSDWGLAGYILFQRGVNLCGIEGYVATVTVTG